MKDKESLRGRKFGRLEVLFEEPYTAERAARCHCRCDCGKEKTIVSASLKRGATKSCGCLSRDTATATHTTHGGYKCPEYHVWDAMIQRCHNPKNASFTNYGARGIMVCDNWRDSFENFVIDMGPANGLTLDRINNDGDYTPENCRWTDRSTQQSNRGIQSNNISGVTGVSRHKGTGGWVAELIVQKERVYRKLFHTYDEAVAARRAAELKYRGW